MEEKIPSFFKQKYIKNEVFVQLPDISIIEKLRICIVKEKGEGILQTLVQKISSGVKNHLEKHGVIPENIREIEAPNSSQIPFTAQLAALSGKFDEITCIGIVVKEDNNRFDSQSHTISQGILDVQLSSKIPIIDGVLNFLDNKQAEEYLTKNDDLEVALTVSLLKMGNTLIQVKSNILSPTKLSIPILGVTQPCETPL